MIILKKVDAIDVLNDLAEENSSLADLLYEIEEGGKEDALDWVVSNEYPNGVEEEELLEFFLNEQKFIKEQIGLAGEDDEEGEDEEDENENEES